MIARIRDRDSFVRLRRRGVRLRNESLWCSYLHDPDVMPPRVAFAIGRAVGSAVTRNRLRRRIKSILATTDVPAGLFLIGATAASTELTFGQLQTTVTGLMEAARRQVER